MKANQTTPTILASKLKSGDRIMNEHGFVQEVHSTAPHSGWGIRVVTTYDLATGCGSQVIDRMTRLTLTDAEPHGENNPF